MQVRGETSNNEWNSAQHEHNTPEWRESHDNARLEAVRHRRLGRSIAPIAYFRWAKLVRQPANAANASDIVSQSVKRLANWLKRNAKESQP